MTGNALYLRQLRIGPMENFVYLMGAEGSDQAIVVDPAWDVPAIEAAAAADGKRIVGAFVSHSHLDHINGLPELLRSHDVPVFAHKEEVAFSPELRRLGDAVRATEAGEALTVAGLRLKVLHTPGHTPGSQCLHLADALVSGDTVFVNGCGRCDLRGGDPEALYRTVTQVLSKLPEETVLFPGHDYADVPCAPMRAVKAHNPYFQFADLRSFVDFRMRPRR